MEESETSRKIPKMGRPKGSISEKCPACKKAMYRCYIKRQKDKRQFWTVVPLNWCPSCKNFKRI